MANPNPYHRAFLGLGSNLGSPLSQVLAARDLIAATTGIDLLASSSLYRTAPVDCQEGQPDYINAVVEIATSLSPLQLLHCLFAIERDQGRERPFVNSPRTLDVDLLIYGDLQMHSPELILPHPRAHLRAFVLLPLLEIAPDCHFPGLGAAADYLPACADQGISRVATRPFTPARRARAA